MIRWRLDELMEQYREATGEPLKPTHLAQKTGLAPSTIHKHVHRPPLRVDFQTLEVLLKFFSNTLGPLTTQDLVEFVNQPQEE